MSSAKNAFSGKERCSKKVLQMLGDFWTLSIIQALSDGEMRFSQIQREVEGVNPVTLTNRLKRLEESGLVERQKETLDKLSVTYSLTKKGDGILPVLREIRMFSAKYL